MAISTFINRAKQIKDHVMKTDKVSFYTTLVSMVCMHSPAKQIKCN